MNRLAKRVFMRRRPLLASGAVILFFAAGNGILWFIIPQLAVKLTGSLLWVGLLVALPGVVAFFADIPLGDLSDRVGGSLVLKTGFVGLIVLGLFFSQIHSTKAFIVFLVLFGFLVQMIYVPLAAHVMEISPPKERCGYFGAYHSMFNLGFAVGPLIGGYLLGVFSGSGLLSVSAVYGILCLLALLLAHTSIRDSKQVREGITEGVRDVIKKDKLVVKSITDFSGLNKVGVVVLALSFLLTFFDGMVWTLIPVYYLKLGLSSVFGGLLMAAFMLPLVLLEYPAGLLADRCGERRVLAFGLLLTGVSAMAFSRATMPAGMIATAFLASTGLAFCWPSVEGMLLSAAEDRGLGEITGVWESAMNLGYIAGPLFGGVVAYQAGIPQAFVFSGVMILLAGLITFRMR